MPEIQWHLSQGGVDFWGAFCVCVVVNRTVYLPTEYENLKRAITVHMLWYKLFFSIWLKSMLCIFMWHKGALKETRYFDRSLVSWNSEVSGDWRCLEQLCCTLFHQGPHIRSTERKWSRWKKRSQSEPNWIMVVFVCSVKIRFWIFQTFGPMTDTTEEEVENKQKSTGELTGGRGMMIHIQFKTNKNTETFKMESNTGRFDSRLQQCYVQK